MFPRDVVCLKNISINTLHKGDDDDDDDDADDDLYHSFISNLSDDRSTASSKTIPPLNAI
jgi:hypothetical protein